MKKKIIATSICSAALCCVNFCTGFSLVKPVAEEKYCGYAEFEERSETINYARRETEEYGIVGTLPTYYPNTTSNSSCANVAGTVVIGYYDRLCEELIPNFQTYRKLGTGFVYKGGRAETNAVMDSLYTLMGTDVGGAGTTFNGFHAGMKSYVEGHGYSYQTEDIGSLNFESYKTAVKNNKPVALFLSNFSFRQTSNDDGSKEILNYDFCNASHVVVGYGYMIDTYYDNYNNVIATRTYLSVASGFVTYNLSYLCLDGKSSISYASAVTIL